MKETRIIHFGKRVGLMIHNPRTAGSSVAAALQVKPGHAGAWSVCFEHLVTADEWRYAMKFCFVRNPWARAVSWWKFNVGDANIDAFRRWVGEGMKTAWNQPHWKANPNPFDQSIFYAGSDGKVLVDVVYKFESLATSWLGLCRRLKIDERPMLPHIQTSLAGLPWQEWHTPATIRAIADVDAATIERFDYRVE